VTSDDELAALRAKLDSLACSDHGCRLLSARRGGMGTNGGCHCHRDRTAFVVSQALAARHRQVVLLLAENERLRALRDEVEAFRDCGSYVREDGSIRAMFAALDAARAKGA